MPRRLTTDGTMASGAVVTAADMAVAAAVGVVTGLAEDAGSEVGTGMEAEVAVASQVFDATGSAR